MQRYLYHELKSTIKNKMLLVSGPRQVGKTTLAKSLCDSYEYLNFDSSSHRRKIKDETWDREKEIIIFDEIHKMKKWKLWLKGVYDTEENKRIIVTGSAKLNTYRKFGDSLAGRYFMYHLMPLDLKELKINKIGKTKENLEKLMQLSGFPEPFLNSSLSFYNKWKKTHLDVIIKEDLPESEAIRRLNDVAFLVELMRERVGSVFSYNSLREDLNTDDKSIKRWLTTLENLYVLFKITPYFSKNLKNGTKKLPKYYFYDFPRVVEDGARLENLVALSLLKEIMFRNDVHGEDFSLHYLRNKKKEEIDFLVCKNNKPHTMIEVKSSDDRPSDNFHSFEPYLIKQNPQLKKVQLVKGLKKRFSTKDKIHVENLETWLESMNF
jgi:uncharacterized protein